MSQRGREIHTEVDGVIANLHATEARLLTERQQHERAIVEIDRALSRLRVGIDLYAASDDQRAR